MRVILVPKEKNERGTNAMLSCYIAKGGKPAAVENIEKDCWVSLIEPNECEIARVVSATGADADMLRAALDEEETCRIEQSDEGTLIIVDFPFEEKSEGGQSSYLTLPFGIVVTENYVITVCLKESSIINELVSGKVKGLNTAWKTKFIFQLLMLVAAKYLQYLRQVDRISKGIEKQLHMSMKNKELIQLLDLEKSLVFFTTSLKANESMLHRLLRGHIIKLYEDDKDLLQDVLVEFHQAIEMANIYSSILSGTMDAFASIISNNLNIVMKVLTVITIILAIPNMIFSFYGMNVGLAGAIPGANLWWTPILLAALATAIATYILYKKQMF